MSSRGLRICRRRLSKTGHVPRRNKCHPKITAKSLVLGFSRRFCQGRSPFMAGSSNVFSPLNLSSSRAAYNIRMFVSCFEYYSPFFPPTDTAQRILTWKSCVEFFIKKSPPSVYEILLWQSENAICYNATRPLDLNLVIQTDFRVRDNGVVSVHFPPFDLPCFFLARIHIKQ